MAQQWLQLAGRCCIITGAGSGIGKGISKAFVQQGCNVILADIDTSNTDSIADSLIKSDSGDGTHPEILTVRCDVTNPADVKKLFKVADELARESSQSRKDVLGSKANPPNVASVLVNCAGITKDNYISKMEISDFDEVINVNLKGTFLTCREFASPDRLNQFPNYGVNGSGSIINIGSVVGSYGNIGQSNYAASKGGVVSLTRSLAKEIAKFNVRANCILPGFINTPMIETVPPKLLERTLKQTSLNRLGTVEDITDLCLFLASSKRSGFITGQGIECSGLLAL